MPNAQRSCHHPLPQTGCPRCCVCLLRFRVTSRTHGKPNSPQRTPSGWEHMPCTSTEPRRQTTYNECAERTLSSQILIFKDFKQLFLKALLHNTLRRKKILKFLGLRADTPFPRSVVNRVSYTNYTHHPSQPSQPLQPIVFNRLRVQLQQSAFCVHTNPAGQIAADS